MPSTPISIEFGATKAHGRLRELASRPFDLTAPGALSPDRIGAMRCSGAGFDLLYATQRVDGESLAALADLAAETRAVDRLGLLMAGGRMNRVEGHESEDRRVLHAACRDLFDGLPGAPPLPEAAAETAQIRAELEKLERFLGRLEGGGLVNGAGERFTTMVNIGIGGSDLGPRALYLALRPFRLEARRVRYLSNLDPDDAARTLEGLDLARTLVSVVSKSGTTTETLANEALLRQAFAGAGLAPERHFLCVTGAGSPMDEPTRYLAVFHLSDAIGGRFSATSVAGGVSLGFALGYDGFRELLRGAREMDLASLVPEPESNPALLAALLGIWNRTYLGLPSLAVLPYSQALVRFTAHLQQLDMESNGKRTDRQGRFVDYPTGPIVWGEPGTNGQHAFYQSIHQGTSVVPSELIGFRHSQSGKDIVTGGTTSQQKLLANLLAQSLALAAGRNSANPNREFPGNRPNSVLMADRLDPRTAGALLAFYENKIALQGLIWNINSFDQEGVRLGKEMAGSLEKQFGRGESGSGESGGDPVGRAMLHAAGVG